MSIKLQKIPCICTWTLSGPPAKTLFTMRALATELHRTDIISNYSIYCQICCGSYQTIKSLIYIKIYNQVGMIPLRIRLVLIVSLHGQTEPAVGDVIHLMIRHLNISPGESLIHGRHTAETVGLNHGGGIRGGVTGVLKTDALMNRLGNSINRCTEYKQQQKQRKRKHDDKAVVVAPQRQQFAKTVIHKSIHRAPLKMYLSSSGTSGKVAVL